MKTWLKWVSMVVLLVLAVPPLLMLFLDQAHYKQQISNAVEAKTGRPLSIEGDLKLKFGVKPAIYVESIRYPNAPWAEHPWALEADRATLTFDLWELLRGKLLVEDIVLHRPKLRVEKNADGVHNLAIASTASTARKARALPRWLNVSGAEIIDGEITVTTRNRRWDIGIAEARAESTGRDQPVAVDFRGEIEQTPAAASATLGSLETLFAFAPSPVAIDGWIGDEANRVSASGSARNLLKWRGIDLGLNFSVAKTAELSALARATLPDIGPVDGHARLYQPASIRTIRLQEIELSVRRFGLRGTVTGEIAKPYSRAGIDLNLVATGTLDYAVPKWLAKRAGSFNTGLNTGLNATLDASLRGSLRNLTLTVETATAENAGLSVDARGAVRRIDGIWQGALPVSLTLEEVDARRGLPGRELAPIGPVTANAELTRDRASWNLNNLKLSLEREGLTIKAAGAVNHLLAGPTGHLYFIAEAADDRYLRALFDDALPAISELELGVAVAFGAGIARATVDKLNGRVAGVDLSASGTIDELNRWRGIDLVVVGHATGLHDLPSPGGGALPRTAPLRMRARLADDPSGALRLTNITASLTDPRVEWKAQGEIRDLGASMRADIEMSLDLATLEPVRFLFANSELTAEFVEAALPLTVAATLYSAGAADWGIRNIKAVSRADGVNARVSGELAALAPLEGRLHLTLARLATSRLPRLGEIPRLRDGALDLSLDLVAKQGGFGVENLTAGLVSRDASVTLQGDINRLSPLAIRNLKLDFEAAGVTAPGAKDTGFFNPGNPVSGSVTTTAGAHGQRSDLRVKIGQSDLRGTVDWRLPDGSQTVPWVRAKLVSDQLSIKEILAPAAKNKKSRVFSTAPFNTDWIRKLEGRIDLAAEKAGNHLVDMRDVTMRTVLHRGKLQQTISGRMGRGKLSATLAVDANPELVSAEFSMTGKHLDTAGLAAFRKDNYINNGTFDWDIVFAGEGVSMAGLAANATGNVVFRLDRAKIKNQRLDIIGGDIFHNVITAILPFQSVGEYVNIECGIMRFDIDQGMAVAQNSLAMKTDKVTFFGGGGIDLSDESLQILISPKARRGIGLNPSSLAKMVRVGGTLAEPALEIAPSGLFVSGAAVWAALSSGGLSLLAQGLLDRVKANADVCRRAEPPKSEKNNVTVQPTERK